MIVNALPENHPLKSKSLSSPSINEAIVSARAREEALQQQQRSTSYDTKKLEVEIEARVYEKAKEKMELELRSMETKFKLREEERFRNEQMERERMETELRRELSYERWKEDVTKEKMQQQQKEGESNDVKKQKNEEQVHINVMTNLIEEQEVVTNREDGQLYPIHPILGPQIAILPYKRVHLTPASILASIPVYERQRAYRHDRALTMAKDKRKTLWMGIPGVISLIEDDDGRLSILDGQHRVGMMALLAEERRKKRGNNGETNNNDDDGDELDTLDLDNILVEVYISSRNDITDDMAAAIFTEINKAEPVKLLDLPGVTTKRTRDIIDHAALHFADTYPAMFSTSARCRAPHLNLDNLRDSLFASNVIQREKFGSGSELVKWMLARNDELREMYGGNGSASKTNENDGGDNASEAVAEVDGKISMSDTAVKKARKYDFYLGLESTWLYKKK
jgi:actin-related protein